MKEYIDRIVEKYKKWTPIIHPLKEEKRYEIELKNNENKSLLIELYEEATISFGTWHCHYPLEDEVDLEDILEVLDSILDNQECIIIIYSNDKCFGSGSISHKIDYKEEDIYEFLDSFFGKKWKENESFQNFGIQVKCSFWDSSKDYEINIDKEGIK